MEVGLSTSGTRLRRAPPAAAQLAARFFGSALVDGARAAMASALGFMWSLVLRPGVIMILSVEGQVMQRSRKGQAAFRNAGGASLRPSTAAAGTTSSAQAPGASTRTAVDSIAVRRPSIWAPCAVALATLELRVNDDGGAISR